MVVTETTVGLPPERPDLLRGFLPDSFLKAFASQAVRATALDKIRAWPAADRKKVIERATADYWSIFKIDYSNSVPVEPCVSRAIVKVFCERRGQECAARATHMRGDYDLAEVHETYMPWVRYWVRKLLTGFSLADREDAANEVFSAFVTATRQSAFRGKHGIRSEMAFFKRVTKNVCAKRIEFEVKEREAGRRYDLDAPKVSDSDGVDANGDCKNRGRNLAARFQMFSGSYDDPKDDDYFQNRSYERVRDESVFITPTYDRRPAGARRYSVSDPEARYDRKEAIEGIFSSLKPKERALLSAWSIGGRSWLHEFEPVSEPGRRLKPTRNQAKKVLEGARKALVANAERLGYKLSDFF